MEYLDFYLGRGKQAEWLGSVAAPVIDLEDLELADRFTSTDSTEHLFKDADFRAAVDQLLENVGGRWAATVRPHDGWPHPYDKSTQTALALAWQDGAVWVHEYGHVTDVHYANAFRNPSEFPTYIPRTVVTG